MIVVGAGMAGLLAGAMLQDDLWAIYEAQEKLPNNHSAVLRFRSSIVADTLNIPFKKVQVLRAVAPWQNAVADAMAYSRKTNGSGVLRSILKVSEGSNERWIAPLDLITRMAKKITKPMHYGEVFPFGNKEACPVISTIPMPALMKALDYTGAPEFKYNVGWNVVAQLDTGVDAYCSLYVPDPAVPYARVSITGSELVAECYTKPKFSAETVAQAALSATGLAGTGIRSVDLKEQKYAKILPIDEGVRRRFLMWATEKHNVYSLGRFATWRPGLLLDDLVNDTRVIQRLIMNNGESYAHKLKG